jgi:Ras-related protein Rab-5C
MSGEPTDLKIVLIGATSVGKTCIVKRGTTGLFESGTMPTLGASYTSKLVAVNDTSARLLIWDTAGQERYRGITHMYYRNAAAALLVYSINDRDSFNQVDIWLRSLQDNTPSGVLVFLVGNKSDLDENRQVSIQEGQDKATTIHATFSEVSAKTGLGIEELFICVASAALEKRAASQPSSEGAAVDLAVSTGEPESGCC